MSGKVVLSASMSLDGFSVGQPLLDVGLERIAWVETPHVMHLRFRVVNRRGAPPAR